MTSLRRVLVTAGVAATLCLLPTPSQAQEGCYFDIGVYVDGFYEPNASTLYTWGSGVDYSYCPGGFCYHAYQYATWIQDVPSGQVLTYTTFEGGSGETSATVIAPGTYAYVGQFFVYCNCYGGWVDVGGSGTIEVPPGSQQCAIPTDFRQINVQDMGGGVLRFDYEWDSSTGNLGALSSCSVGEIVSYPQTPWPPPFPLNSPPNPTEINFPGSDGGFSDVHSTGAGSEFRTPYFEATFVASQAYRWSCPCQSGGAWFTVMGPHDIERRVEWINAWYFRLTKRGVSAEMELP